MSDINNTSEKIETLTMSSKEESAPSWLTDENIQVASAAASNPAVQNTAKAVGKNPAFQDRAKKEIIKSAAPGWASEKASEDVDVEVGDAAPSTAAPADDFVIEEKTLAEMGNNG